jgi:hypothetical protein
LALGVVAAGVIGVVAAGVIVAGYHTAAVMRL